MIDPRHVAASDRGLRLSMAKLLFAVLGAPVLWSVHLGVIYVVLTVDCISGWEGGTWAVLLTTAAFAAGSGLSGWVAWSMYRSLGGDDAVGGEREWARFLLVLGIGAAILFTAVIVLEGLSPLFVDLCAPGQ